MSLRIILTLSILVFSTGSMSVYSQPAGITNTGNSCFINSTIQVLLHMSKVSNLLSQQTSNPFDPKSLSYHYTDLVTQLLYAEGPLNIKDFSSKCWKKLNIPQDSQGDANDLLTILLDGLSSEDIDEKFKTKSKNNNLPMTPSEISVATRIDIASVLSHIPSNYVEPLRKEPNNRLLLIVGEKDCTLNDCLNEYVKPEMNFCSPTQNGQLVEGSRQKFIEKTSDFVVFSLERRFYRQSQNNEPDYLKRKNPIAYPLYGLTLKPYFAQPQSCKETYELIGIIMHTGTAVNGHYNAYVKKGQKWYFCNDTEVKEISQDTIEQMALAGYGKTPEDLPCTLVYSRTEAYPQ